MNKTIKKQARSAYKKTFSLLALFATLSSAILQASAPEANLPLFGPETYEQHLLGQDLIEAAQYGQLEKAQELIAQGANVNAANKDGATPLRYAICFDHTEVVKLLLATPGILVNAKNQNGSTHLHCAVYLNRTEIIKLLLNTPGILVNEQDQWGDTPLHRAAAYGRTEVVKLLLATPGILVNEKNNNGDTPLHEAAHWDRTEVGSLLLSHAKKSKK